MLQGKCHSFTHSKPEKYFGYRIEFFNYRHRHGRAVVGSIILGTTYVSEVEGRNKKEVMENAKRFIDKQRMQQQHRSFESPEEQDWKDSRKIWGRL